MNDENPPELPQAESMQSSQSAQPDADRALSALLALNIVLSDVVVIWRVCVLWPGSRCVRLVSVLLLVATAGMLCWGAYLNDDFEDAFSAGAIVSSWLTNVWTTALVAARAWKHREDIGFHLHTVRPASRVSAVLSLLVWSGMLYTLLWTLLMEDALAGLGLGAGPAPAITRFRTAICALKASVLVDLVGMYPAMVAAAVNLSGRFVHRTFCVDDMPSLLPDSRMAPQPVQLSSMRSAAAQSVGVQAQTAQSIDVCEGKAAEDAMQKEKGAAVKNGDPPSG
ncbi:hypothetical protein PsYK624_033010 [Phanerochaete sordida]|uniref:Uncharacterized protein n=1 Tax=Phanerochaete sordida TaxID=48140 RepID=A0A9P3G2S9_9APHY|nr:hypothetical protein PsYK624_033010 [Phanerochaete sordida]